MSVTLAYQSLVKGKALEQQPKLCNFFLFIYLFICLFIYLSIYSFVYLFIYSLFKFDDKNRNNHL